MSEDTKKILTKEEILKPYKDATNFFINYQLACMTVATIFLVIFIFSFIMNNVIMWSYLVSSLPFLIFALTPLYITREARKCIKEIKYDLFFIKKVTVICKKFDEKEFNDYEYYIEVTELGKISIPNKAEWNSCNEGDELYIVLDIKSIPMLIFPLSKYTISNELTHFLTYCE